MSIASWPGSLPGFLIETVSRATPDGRLRSSTDVGPGKVRRRSKAVVSNLAGDMILSMAQKAALETFVETTLIGGVLPFTITDPLDSEATLIVRFGEDLPVYSDGPLGHVRTRIMLEVLP